jgi:hypothetical protein
MKFVVRQWTHQSIFSKQNPWFDPQSGHSLLIKRESVEIRNYDNNERYHVVVKGLDNLPTSSV